MGEPQQSEIEWGEPLEKLLCAEAEKASGYSWLHMRAEAHYSNRSNILQIPVIVLSTLTGFLSAGETGIPQMALGGVSVLVGILGTINSYFAFSKRAEGHRLGATQYGLIHRTIHIEMALPRPQRTPPKFLLKMMKEELKRLTETLPRIPDSVIASYKKEIMPKSSDVSHPEITNGVHKVEPTVGVVAVVGVSPPLQEIRPAPSPIKISVAV